MAKPAANIKELNVRIDKLSEEFKKGIDGFKDEFLKSQSTAITFTNTDVSPLDLLKKFENRINDAINEIKVDIDSLKNNVNTVKKKQQNLEMKHNINLLLVHGISESEKDLVESVVKICNNKIEVQVKKDDLNQCYRVGKKKLDSDKPRPVAVQFLRRWNRDAVFVNKRKLKGTKLLVTEFLSLENLILFKQARKIYGKSVWTHNGIVYRDVKGQKTVINCEQELKNVSVLLS